MPRVPRWAAERGQRCGRAEPRHAELAQRDVAGVSAEKDRPVRALRRVRLGSRLHAPRAPKAPVRRLDASRPPPYLVGGTLTPFPAPAFRRSETNNGTNALPTPIPALLRSNGTGTTGRGGRKWRQQPRRSARGTAMTSGRAAHRESGSRRLVLPHDDSVALLVPDKPCHAVTV